MRRCRSIRRGCNRDWHVGCIYGTWTKVIVTCFRWPGVFVVLHMGGMWRTGSRGCSGGSSQWYIDDEGVFYRLSTWEVSI